MPSKKKIPSVYGMEAAAEIQARNGEDAPADGRFHHVFVLAAESDDWEAPEHDGMHSANRLSTLQAALTNGLHPVEEARFDGSELVPGGKRSSTRLLYSVLVRPGHAGDASETVTPGKVLRAS